MKIKSVELIISAVRNSQFPVEGVNEFLLVGRSNVGKSSFINTITERKNYARISATPGKTQTINFYHINKEFFLVDAPGYGYAKVSKKQKEKFGLMMEDYLANRRQLKHIFLLIDFRHKPTVDDKMMYEFLKHHNHEVTIVATKVDKVGVTQRQKQRNIIGKELELCVEDDFIEFSSVSKEGKLEIHKKIETMILN